MEIVFSSRGKSSFGKPGAYSASEGKLTNRREKKKKKKKV